MSCYSLLGSLFKGYMFFGYIWYISICRFHICFFAQSWMGWNLHSRQRASFNLVSFSQSLCAYKKEQSKVKSLLIFVSKKKLFLKVFSEALVYLSLDGDRFQATPVRIHPVVERARQFTVNVTIPLHNRVGRFLKLQMRFASRWILLSEVSFDSGKLLSVVSDIVMSKVSENSVEWKVADSIKLMAHCTAVALSSLAGLQLLKLRHVKSQLSSAKLIEAD